MTVNMQVWWYRLPVEAPYSLVPTISNIGPVQVRLGFYTMPMDHVISASDVQALPVLLILFRFISYLPAKTSYGPCGVTMHMCLTIHDC